MRPRRALYVGLVLAGLLGAQEAWVRPGLRWVQATYRWRPLAEAGPALRSLAAELGPGWRWARESALGTPVWILGPGLDLDGPLSPEACRNLAGALARRWGPALGVDRRTELRLAALTRTETPHGGVLVGVDFVQTVGGYAVRTLAGACRVYFRFHAARGRLVAFGSTCVPGLHPPPGPPPPAARALQAARALVPPGAPGAVTEEVGPPYLLVGREGERGRVRSWLVRDVILRASTPPRAWRIVVEAGSGTPLYRGPLQRSADVTGTGAAGVVVGGGGRPPTAPFRVLPLRDVYVALLGGGVSLTDARGRFQLPVPTPPPTPLRVAGRFHGRWCSVQNRAGPNTAFLVTASPSTPVNVVLGGTYEELRTAEATAYTWVTATRHYLARYVPGFTALTTLTTYVNEARVCGAYWDGRAIHLARASAVCRNAAFVDVVAHEYGHAFHQWFHRSLNPPWFSEGIGDHLVLYLTGQRQVGRNWYVTGGALRDYRPGRPACCRQWPPTYRSPHHDGEIWGGFVMDLRDGLVAAHGAAKGVPLAERLTLTPYVRNPTDMPDAVVEIFLQDDDDGNLANGTPNFKILAAAADAHRLPRPPDPGPILILHRPLADTADVVNGYPVTAAIVTRAPLARALVVYRVGNTLTTLALRSTARPQTYGAVLPPQKAVTLVRYWLVARDTQQRTARMPPQGSYTFVVGRRRVLFLDDFERPRGWTPARDDNALQGRFERADPIFAAWGRQISQPEDDTTPGAGRRCYVTQNGTRNTDPATHDVDAGRTSIVSPALRLAAEPPGVVHVAFQYWFTDYTVADDVFALALSPDGGRTWGELWRAPGPLAGWRRVRVRVPGPYTTDMRLRFRVADDPNNSVCDALVDDVVVESFDDRVAALRGSTPTPARGALLTYTLAAPRLPRALYLFNIAFRPGPTALPGVGVSGLGLPFFPLWLGVLDGNGRAQFRLPVPNDPGLRGLTVFTEAFLAAPGPVFVFSNRWDLTIQ